MVYNLGERISSLRKEMNLSQEALSEKVGVSRQAISKWERNEATPDIYNLVTLSEIFQVTLDDLVSDDIYSIPANGLKPIGLDIKATAEKLIMFGVAIFILSAFVFVISPLGITFNFIIFTLMIILGVVSIIKAGFLFDRYKKLNQDIEDQIKTKEIKTKKEAFKTIVSVSCTIIYLYLGFFKMLWHPGWLIFLFVPILDSLYDLFISKSQ